MLLIETNDVIVELALASPSGRIDQGLPALASGVGSGGCSDDGRRRRRLAVARQHRDTLPTNGNAAASNASAKMRDPGMATEVQHRMVGEEGGIERAAPQTGAGGRGKECERLLY